LYYSSVKEHFISKQISVAVLGNEVDWFPGYTALSPYSSSATNFSYFTVSFALGAMGTQLPLQSASFLC
jgi:hypothetical protein